MYIKELSDISYGQLCADKTAKRQEKRMRKGSETGKSATRLNPQNDS